MGQQLVLDQRKSCVVAYVVERAQGQFNDNRQHIEQLCVRKPGKGKRVERISPVERQRSRKQQRVVVRRRDFAWRQQQALEFSVGQLQRQVLARCVRFDQLQFARQKLGRLKRAFDQRFRKLAGSRERLI